MTDDEMLALLYWGVAYWSEAIDRLCGGAGVVLGGEFAAHYAMLTAELATAQRDLVDFLALVPAGDQVAICQQ